VTEQTEQVTQEQGQEQAPPKEMTLEELRAENERVEAETREADEWYESQRAKLGSSRTSFAGATAGRTGEADAHEASVVRRNLIREYEGLENDERFTEEHRAQRAWEAYDRARPQVEEKGRAARENLLKAAEQYEQMSIPFPGRHQLRTEQVEHISLTQGERSRIMDLLAYKNPTIERMQKEGKKTPSEPSPQDKLRDEYARGLDIGGPQGAAICRAVVQIAEDQGGSVDEIVGTHRTERQWDYLQSAAEARRQAGGIYTRVPQPNYPRPGGPQSVEELASRKRSALGLPRNGHPGSGSLIPKKQKRRPQWK
jgi:hypothetical protein